MLHKYSPLWVLSMVSIKKTVFIHLGMEGDSKQALFKCIVNQFELVISMIVSKDEPPFQAQGALSLPARQEGVRRSLGAGKNCIGAGIKNSKTLSTLTGWISRFTSQIEILEIKK